MLHQKLILSSFVSFIRLLVSTVQASNTNQPKYLGSICCCIFFPHSGYILMEPFIVLVRDGSHIPRVGGGNPSGIAGNGVSTTCCTPRHGTRNVAPSRVLRGFLIFIFPPLPLQKLPHTFPRAFLPTAFNLFLKVGS
jgi:hypothetical protein